MINYFGTACVCEHYSLTMIFFKNQYGVGLKGKRLENSFHFSISPYINILLSNKQCQFCHSSSFFLNCGERKYKAKDKWKTDTVTYTCSVRFTQV